MKVGTARLIIVFNRVVNKRYIWKRNYYLMMAMMIIADTLCSDKNLIRLINRESFIKSIDPESLHTEIGYYFFYVTCFY